jgi:inner membrane protein
MNCGQHVMVGTLLGVGTQYVTGLPMVGILAYPSFYGGVTLGSLFPDIDHPQSYIGRRIPLIPTLIYKTLGHRGFTHSLLSLSLFGIATAFYWSINPLFFGGFLLGYLSHLLADMTTPSGIPLLYPKYKRFKFFKKGFKR